MGIPEPAGELWAEVSRLTAWPDTDEDTVRRMSAGWRAGGGHFSRAGGFDVGPMVGAWTDRAGQELHGRIEQGLGAAAATGERMADMAGRAEVFAAEVTGVKNGIHALMAANQPNYAMLPTETRAAFVSQVAAVVDAMKAEAAGRIAAAGPSPEARITQEAQGVRNVQGQSALEPPAGGSPEEVFAWWNGLSKDERDFYRRVRPDVIGGLDGVPTADRSEANLNLLDAEIARLEHLDATSPPVPLGAERIAALRALAERFQPGADELYLLKFDNSGDGQAVVAVGNPDTARNVATLVPGISNDIGSLPEQIDRADSLRANKDDTAAIVWLDYNAPESPKDLSLTSLDPSRAEDAKDELSRFQEGLRATHLGDPSHNVVIGHSYGSTVAGLAAASTAGLNADELVVVASTNAGVDRAGDYILLRPDGTPWTRAEVEERVYVTVAPDDPYAGLSTWLNGNDPAAPGFGGTEFTTDAGDDEPHLAPFDPGPTLDYIKRIVREHI
jgi:hypothetical protein